MTIQEDAGSDRHPSLKTFDLRLTQRDFERFSRLVYDQCGIKLPGHKQSMLEARLRKRLRSLGLGSFEEYAELIFSGREPEGELIKLIDVVTTNKTDFFREPAHFDFLVRTALPALIAKDEAGLARPLRIWSAGCSTGKEPYTLAMVLSEFRATQPGFSFEILGTDISTDVLDKAVKGVYAEEKAEPIPPALRRKYLLKAKDSAQRQVRIVPELRSLVRFRRLNFMDADYGLRESFDIIFCRNVLIYFDRPTQERLLTRFAGYLESGRFLFLGHSETLLGLSLPLQQMVPSVYRKI
ncbi:MAG: protein-glutamate O-methyltransferase [Desulfuromonadales bacterium]|nr:protein-glutamate O-methyltransferase [Desulfuromonadales bacterium]